MIMGTISQLHRSLYGPEGCRGLTTEGSGADGPGSGEGRRPCTGFHLKLIVGACLWCA
jgi:hypothetical protein